MFRHKTQTGSRNLCGKRVHILRKELTPKTSQRMLAEMMQLRGADVNKTAIGRIEKGLRYVTDIELEIFCEIFGVSADCFLLEFK